MLSRELVQFNIWDHLRGASEKNEYLDMMPRLPRNNMWVLKQGSRIATQVTSFYSYITAIITSETLIFLGWPEQEQVSKSRKLYKRIDLVLQLAVNLMSTLKLIFLWENHAKEPWWQVNQVGRLLSSSCRNKMFSKVGIKALLLQCKFMQQRSKPPKFLRGCYWFGIIELDSGQFLRLQSLVLLVWDWYLNLWLRIGFWNLVLLAWDCDLDFEI